MRSKPLGYKPKSLPTQGREPVVSERSFIREALSKWSDGDFEGCLLDLDEIGIGRHTSESILLRARALLRLQRAKDAKTWLQMMESLHTNDDAVATHAMLLGSAFSQLQQFERAGACFDTARRASPHPTIVSEIAYYHALSRWQARDLKAARAALQPAIRAGQDIVTARALQLLGFVAIAEHDFAEAHRHFEAALHSLMVCRARDRHLEATLLHALSIGQAEVDGRDPARLDTLAHDFEWTHSLVTEHVQTLRHIGLAYARINEPQLALERMLEAGSVDVHSPWAVIGLSEAANLSYLLNERVNAAYYLRRCTEIADGLNWEDVTGEARMALLHVATVLARCGDGKRARRYLDLYYGRERLGARLPVLSALNFDSRLQSFERHAEGIVRGALGFEDALPMLVDVEVEWRRLKYRYRSEEARQDIRALTHPSYQTCAGIARASEGGDERSAAVANDPEAPSSGAALPAATITVTAQQDRIIRQLVRGRSIAQIADTLMLKQKTVRNHLARVYPVFEVSTQSQLIASILGDPHFRQLFLTGLPCLVTIVALATFRTASA